MMNTKIVYESLPDFMSKKIEKSSGIVIIYDNKILLCHPTNGSWYHSFSFPKGHLEKGETSLEAALRETKEEIGLSINPSKLEKQEHVINYFDKKGNLYKQVFYYLYYPKKEIDTNLLKLQLDEVDYANFYSKEEAQKRIFWRLKDVIKFLD